MSSGGLTAFTRLDRPDKGRLKSMRYKFSVEHLGHPVPYPETGSMPANRSVRANAVQVVWDWGMTLSSVLASRMVLSWTGPSKATRSDQPVAPGVRSKGAL